MQYGIIETCTTDGKPKRKTFKSKSYKKPLDDKNEQLLSVHVIEEDYEPMVYVNIETKPIDNTNILPIILEELPEKIVEYEVLDLHQKPIKKKIKQRTFKKDTLPEPEFYQIQTIEEVGQLPLSTIQIVTEENLTDIIDISLLEDENIAKYINKKPKHKTLKDKRIIPQKIKDEKPVYVTTFKSIQGIDGDTIIQSKNKKITHEKGAIIEEVLSDTESIQEHQETTSYKIEIVEIDEDTDKDTKEYTITEPEDVYKDTIQTQYTHHNKAEKVKMKKPKHAQFNIIEESPEEMKIEHIPQEFLDDQITPIRTDIGTTESTTQMISVVELVPEIIEEHQVDSGDKQSKIHKKKKKLLQKTTSAEHLIEIIETPRETQEYSFYTVTVLSTEKEDIKQTKQPKQPTLPKKRSKKVKQMSPDEFEKFLIAVNEQPVDEIDDYDFYEVSITELEPDQKDNEVETRVEPHKKRRIHHKKGLEESIIDIIESPSLDEGEPLFEVIVHKIDELKDVSPLHYPTKVKSKKPKKMKKFEIDSYIQQLIDAEIPKTELEQYEKIQFVKRPKKIKKQKPQKIDITPIEDDFADISVLDYQPTEKSVDVEQLVPCDELKELQSIEEVQENIEKFNIKISETKPEKEQTICNLEEDVSDYSLKTIGKEEQPAKVLIKEMSKQEETVLQIDQNGKKIEKTKTKHKIKKHIGPKIYDITVIETQSESQPIAEVTVITSEVVPTSNIDIQQDKVKPKIKKKVSKIEKEKLNEYLINVISEVPDESDIQELMYSSVTFEDIAEKRPEPNSSVMDIITEDKFEQPEVCANEKPSSKEDMKPKKLKSGKQKKIKISEDELIKPTDDIEEVTIEETFPVYFVDNAPVDYQIAIKKEDYSNQSIILKHDEVKELERTPSTHSVKIIEVQPETVVKKIIDENGEITSQTITKRKHKKQQGPKEYMIEIVESTVEKEPEGNIQVIITDTTTEKTSEIVPQEEVTVKKFKKKKPSKNEEDEYVQHLIEQDIPKTKLEIFEQIEFDKIPKKKLKSVKEQHSKSIEIIDGMPVTIHEFKTENLKPYKTPILNDTFFIQETIKKNDKEPETTVTVEETPADEQPEKVQELPEEVRVIEIIPEEGKPKKKKIRTRIIKKVKGDKQEVTKIETVEEDDKKPETTVTVEEIPADEQPERVQELPEEVRVIETISEEGKPKKKKIRTRIIKKVKGDKQEVTKIETVEEDDKKPETTVTVEETLTDEQPEKVQELPEEVRVIESISEEGKPKKKKIRTRIIKKIRGDKQEVTKIKTVEEDDKKPETTVTVEEIPADEQPEKVQELPEEVRVIETISEEGKPKKKKIRTRIIKKVKGDKQEVTKIETVEEDDKKPETIVTVEETPADEKPEKVQELPEEIRVIETISEEGKPKKKKIRTRIIKKIRGDKQEVTKIETVEEDDKKPETTVTVEEIPADEQPEKVQELPEEVRVIETISEEGKPKKKKIRTRIIKKIRGDKQEVTKIETVEEDDKKPETTVTVEEILADEQPEKVQELPEEVRVIETISEEGKPKKKKIRTRIIKKIRGDKQEVTKIETVEEDDKKPETTVTVEETPADEEAEKVHELPEQVRVIESISEEGKPKKKKIRTRIIKKIRGDKQEVTKIETVEEDDKKPETVVTVEETPTDEQPATREPGAQITVSTIEPNILLDIAKPHGKKPSKTKKDKKVKKDDLQDYIRTLIEADIPKTELEKYEKIDVDLEKPKKYKKVQAEKAAFTEDLPQQQIVSKAPFDIKEKELNKQEILEDFYKITTQVIDDIDHSSEKDLIITKATEITLPKKEVPKMMKKVDEDVLQKSEETILKDKPHEILDIVTPKEKEYEYKIIEDDYVKEKQVLEKPIEEVIKTKKEAPDESIQFEIIVHNIPANLQKETQELTEEIDVAVEENINNIDKINITTSAKKKVKHQESPKNEVYNTIESISADKPDHPITISEINVEDQQTNDKTSVKTKMKKVKKDDLTSYVQKLIEEEVPKTKLEQYEKIDFGSLPKPAKQERKYSLDIEAEQPLKEEESQIIKNKVKVSQPNDLIEDSILQVTIREEEAPIQEEPLSQITIVETEQPAAVIQKIIDEVKQIKQQIVEKSKLEEQIHEEKLDQIYNVTVHEDNNVATTAVIPTAEVLKLDEQSVIEEIPSKLKKPKKIVKKIPKDKTDYDTIKLIEETVPKPTLEKIDITEQPSTVKADELEYEIFQSTDDEIKPVLELVDTILHSEKPKQEVKQISDTEYKIQIIETDIVETKTEKTHILAPSIQEAPSTNTEQTTLQSNKEIPLQETITPITHKIKPITHTIDTIETTTELKDYYINVIEEEPEEKIAEKIYPEEDKKLEITVIEEIPEIQQLPQSVLIIEEEIETTPKSNEELPKPKKSKKKSIKKINEHDLIIQKLLEQEIEKTPLEKFEKIEFEKPQKAKQSIAQLEPIRIERREQKPKKLVITETTEIPQMVKLKPVKRKEKLQEEQTTKLPIVKLKSIMKLVEYPEEPLKLIISEIHATKLHGELSRNIEEAEEALKFKPIKIKKIKKPKNELEKLEPEKHEMYVSPEKGIDTKVTYQKTTKPKEFEENDEVKIKTGKGKMKPIEEEQPETVTLKAIPEKPQITEDVEEKVSVKRHEIIIKEEASKPYEPQYQMKPLEPIQHKEIEHPEEDLLPTKLSDTTKEDFELLKPKRKLKPKSKPEEVDFKEEKILQEKPVEQFKITVKDEMPQKEEIVKPTLYEITTIETAPKIKPIDEVKVVDEETKSKSVEEVPKEYKIRTVITEPQQIVEEYKVSVTDVDEKEVTIEEVIEKKVVTRKKKPKSTVPEQYEYTVEEPSEDMLKPIEILEEAVFEVEKAIQPVISDTEELKITKKRKVKKPEKVDQAVEFEIKFTETDIQKPVKVTDELQYTLIKSDTPKEVIDTVQEPKPEPTMIPETKVETYKTYDIKVLESVMEEPKPEETEEILVKPKLKPAKTRKDERPDEFKVNLIEEIVPDLTKSQEIQQEEIKVKEEKPKEDYINYKIKVIDESPLIVEKEVVNEHIEIVRKKKPKQFEEPEQQVSIVTEIPLEEYAEDVSVKKKIKKPKKDEELDELKIKIVEDMVPESPKIQETRENKSKVKEEKPKEDYVNYKVQVIEESPLVVEKEIIEQRVVRRKKTKQSEEPEEQVFVITRAPLEEVSEEVTIKKELEKPKTEEKSDEIKVKVVEDIPGISNIQDIQETVQIKEEEPKINYIDYEIKIVEESPVTLKEEVIEDNVQAILKKKFKKPKKEEKPEELKVKLVEEIIPELPQIPEKQIHQEVEAVKPKEAYTEYKVEVTEESPSILEEEIVEEHVHVIRRKKPTARDEPEEQVSIITKSPVEEVSEEIKIKKKPKKPKVSEDTFIEKTINKEDVIIKERPIEEIETEPTKIDDVTPIVEKDVVEEEQPRNYVVKVVEEIPESVEEIPSQQIKLPKKVKPSNIEEEVEVTFKKKLKKPKSPEDEIVEVTLATKKPKEYIREDIEVDEEITMPKKEKLIEEIAEETMTIKKKSKSIKPVKEASEELIIKKAIPEEKSIIEEEVVEEAVILRKKHKKPIEKKLEELEEEHVSLSFKKPYKVDTGIEEVATILQKKPEKPRVIKEADVELSIKREEEYEINEEDVEDYVISKKRKPKAKPIQITEVEEQEFTIEKRGTKIPDIQEYTGEEIIILPRSQPITEENVEQEFSVSLDSYAQEELSMSSKVKLKKPIKKVYAEESEEAKIHIIQEHDLSSIEDTMDGIEEPEEYQIDELPVDDVDIKLRRKHSPKTPRYSIQNEEEQDVLIEIFHPKTHSITYEEESLTLKKKRKILEQVYNEEGASLSITKEMSVEEIEEENVMYSICNYVADHEEAINLVEGEKVYVIGRHSSEWWYVRKSITLEEGWVPAQYLMEEIEYTQYVQKKLHEKIDKLPVFEHPGQKEKATAPRFIEKLHPVHTPDGYTIQFECKVEGMPRPQIAWFRETAIIKPSQDFHMYYDEDNVATLIIREVFPEDAGHFTCVAKNAVGFASSTTELIVEAPLSDHGSDTTGVSRKSMSRESSLADILEGIPPTFARKPKAQYVDELTNVLLEIRLVAVPEPEIVWTFNNEEIDTTHSENVRIVTESDMHMYCSVVHITKVKKSQEGIYQVIATNREGVAKLPLILKVRTNNKEPPQILEPLHNTIINEGESVVLSTQIIGNPPPSIRWFKDGKPIQNNTKSDKDVHSLTLVSPKCNEKGEYVVKAENPLGSVKTTAYLTIEEAPSGNPEPPLFIERFEEQIVPQKSLIRLPAKVSGNPVPEVQWLFNNNPLYPNERIQQMYDGENIELSIKDANPNSDSGDYKCIASNPLGKTSHGARVIVEVEDITFIKKLKSKVIIEEQQLLILECETSHVTSPKWFFNSKQLTGMDHRVVVEDGKIHKLVIRNTNLKDSGKYICKVKTKETHSTVEVLPRKPEFTKVLEDYEVNEKDTAIWEVEISTDSAEVQWFKDNDRLTKETTERIDFIKDVRVHRLVIRDVCIHDEGEYTCRIEDQQCKAELTVIELPPEIIKPLKQKTVTEGEDVIFETELSKGDALVKWYRNNKEITFDERIQLSIDGKYQKLIIKKTEQTDAAEYSIHVGEQTSTAKLIVEEPLVNFTLPLPDVTIATKNTDIEFTVKLSKPDVNVTWYQKGTPIKSNAKYEIFVEGTVRRLIIHNVDNDDVGEISCSAANVTTTSKLCVEEVKIAPVIISNKEQTIKVKEEDDVTLIIKYSGVPKPEAEWTTSKNVVVKSKRTIPYIDEQSASLTIRKVVPEDADDYTIKLVNSIGETEAHLHLIIMRKPSAPGTPQPLEITHDSITLYWKPPEDNGETDIIEYILEYSDIKTEKWTEVRKIKDTTYTLNSLQIDTEYIFRAIAINEVGSSPPSPTSSPIRLKPQVQKERPTIQEPLQDTFTEPNKELTLSCIFGGVPEPKITWKKNGKTIEISNSLRYENRTAKYIIEKTTIETEGVYSCVAENEIGHVETSCQVKIQQKPYVELEEKYLMQKLRTGTNITIPAVIKGYPKPKVKWFRKDTLLETAKYEIIETTTTETTATTTMTIEKLTRKDSGQYKIIAENNYGTHSAEFTLSVVDKPQRPQSLIVKETKKDAVTLEWLAPNDDGGIEINQYILEKYDVQKKIWMKVSDFERTTFTYTIQKLSINSEYKFRIIAVNPIGESEPTESETVIIAKKFDKPSPPRKPIDVSGMNDKSFVLCWEVPEFDGGTKLLDYIVEIKEFHETSYKHLGCTNGNVPHILVKDVEQNHSYTFRIYAKNEVGISDALETEDRIVVSRRITPPSPPQNLRTPDITSRSVTLDWEIPAHNGGSEVTGYCIEKRSANSTTWTRVITLDAHCLQYTVDNLKEKSDYWFRVSAENEAGLGAPAITDSISLKTHATVPSPPTAPLETRILAANVHVFEWGIPESDGGAPLLGYHIAIRDMKKTMWIEVGRVPAGILKFQIRDLQENHEYMIRIFAKNEIGLSEPLESDEPYKVVTTGHLNVPDEPHTELSTMNTSSWLREHNMIADIHSYVRSKLLRRDEYFFRLWVMLPKKNGKRGSK